MQIRNSVSSGTYLSYRKRSSTSNSEEFRLKEDAEPKGASGHVYSGVESRRQDNYDVWMTQRTKGTEYLRNTVLENDTGAVTIAQNEEEGEFLGLTMVPEEGQSVTYGMRAMLSDKSTPTNPIVQVISNLGGKKEIYNVDISKVDPKNATQLEMFALLSYTDKKGITDGGTFGSYQQLQTYAYNASQSGYCDSLSGEKVFLNERFNWSDIIEKVMQDYLEAGISKQYEDCRKLLDAFLQMDPDSDENSVTETALEENTDLREALKEKMNEFLEKIKNGATEATYQIGAQSFTEKEWEKFLEQFDSIEEAIRELMRERHAKEEEEQIAKKQDEKATVIEKLVVSLPTLGISFYYNYSTGVLECVDDTDSRPGRQIRWSKELSGEEFDRCSPLFEKYKGERTWEYKYEAYLGNEDFWDRYMKQELDLGQLNLELLFKED